MYRDGQSWQVFPRGSFGFSTRATSLGGRPKHMSRNLSSPLRIGYVVSMAQGLQSFVYREVRELFADGVIVHLFPTKVGPGSYPPDAGWPVHKISLPALILTHFQTLMANSQRYLAVLREALVLGGLVDFGLAVFVARTAQEQGLRLIHCHFGDHKLFVGYFCGRLSDDPVSVTIHAYELYNNPNPRLFRRALDYVRAIVAVAEYNRDVLTITYGVDPTKIYVVPLFADLPPETDPSGDREGIPVSLMEAMSYGLPVVATRHAGIPELVSEILVDEGDVDGLARGIDQLGRDPILREELGRRNRELVRSNFS